jgi:hypothetical protein
MLLKWKPIEKNTVDFKIRQQDEDGRNVFCVGAENSTKLYAGGKHGSDIEVSESRLSAEEKRKWSDAMERRGAGFLIIECQFDQSKGEWRLVEERPDKREANYIAVAFGTIENIVEAITRVDLERCCCNSVLAMAQEPVEQKQPASKRAKHQVETAGPPALSGGGSMFVKASGSL